MILILTIIAILLIIIIFILLDNQILLQDIIEELKNQSL